MNRITDLLALSHVPRWSIVDHVKPQSVGDHTFRVLVIATEISMRIRHAMTLEMLLYILQHDADESYTADIPTPAKKKLKIDDSVQVCAWREDCTWTPNAKEMAIFHLADQIEAYTFIRRYGIGAHAREVELKMALMVDDMVREFEIRYAGKVKLHPMIQEICNDYGRGKGFY